MKLYLSKVIQKEMFDIIFPLGTFPLKAFTRAPGKILTNIVPKLRMCL